MTDSVILKGLMLLLMSAVLASSPGCDRKRETETSLRIDSLLTVLDGLHSDIGSPGIQRLNEIHNEMKNDLDLLLDRPEAPEYGSGLIRSYHDLYVAMNSCLASCNNYHQEAFLIEKVLHGLKEQLSQTGEVTLQLRTRLNEETLMLEELKHRLDSNLNATGQHVSRFYEFKPRIDSLINTPVDPPGKNE